MLQGNHQQHARLDTELHNAQHQPEVHASWLLLATTDKKRILAIQIVLPNA